MPNKATVSKYKTKNKKWQVNNKKNPPEHKNNQLLPQFNVLLTEWL